MPATSQNILSQDNAIKNQTILIIDGHRVQLNSSMDPCGDTLNCVKDLLLHSFFVAEANAKKI